MLLVFRSFLRSTCKVEVQDPVNRILSTEVKGHISASLKRGEELHSGCLPEQEDAKRGEQLLLFSFR